MGQVPMFKKAVITGRKLKGSVQGPSGSGKTTMSLRMGKGICEREGGRVVLLDSEDGRALLESTLFDFDHCDLRDLGPGDRLVTPLCYERALREAAKAGYTVTIIDSLSHEWEAILRMKDELPAKEQYTGWAKVNPKHDAVFRAMLEHPGHLIVTLRSRMEHVMDASTHKVSKVGMAPVMRDRSEYEFDLAFELDINSNACLAKRPRGIFKMLDGYSKREPGEELGHVISDALRGLNEAAAVAAKPVGNLLDEKAQLRADLHALDALFGGRAKLLTAIGWKESPKELGQARECLRLAKAAHEAALAYDDGPESPDSIPFDEEEAASSPGPQSPATPTGAAPPPHPPPPLKVVPSTSTAKSSGPDANQSPTATQKRPGDGGKQATTGGAPAKGHGYVPLADLWPTLMRLGVTKSQLAIDLQPYKVTVLNQLKPEQRDEYLEKARLAALPKVEALRYELGMLREQLEELSASMFNGVCEPADLSARELADLLHQLGLSAANQLGKSAKTPIDEIVAAANLDVPV